MAHEPGSVSLGLDTRSRSVFPSGSRRIEGDCPAPRPSPRTTDRGLRIDESTLWMGRHEGTKSFLGPRACGPAPLLCSGWASIGVWCRQSLRRLETKTEAIILFQPW